MAVGGGLLVWLIMACEPEALMAALRRARPEPLWAASGLFLFGVVFSAVPWKLLLEPAGLRLSWRDTVELSLMGFCVNNLVPGGIGGDALRAWAAARQTRRAAPAVASVLLDRWLAFVCLVLMLLVLGGLHAGALRERGLLPVTLASMAFLLVMLGVSLALYAWGIRLARPLLERFSMGAPVQGVVDALRTYGSHRGRVLLCLALTLVTPVLDGLGFWLIGLGLGLDLPLWPYLLMIPVLRVIHHLPVSVNAVGTQDAAIVFFWAAFAVPQADALVMSMAAHALKIAVAIVCGGIWLGGWGGRLRVSGAPLPPASP